MGATKLEGKITYINHDKHYAMLEYEAGGKKRVVKANLKQKQADNKLKQNFSSGDVVHFTLLHVAGTDRQEAANVEFKYNTALDVVLQKAKINNDFLGYVKEIDGNYFIKEINSYLFFKLGISKWQNPPAFENAEAVAFYFEDIEKRDKLVALLFDNDFIPDYKQAIKLHKQQQPVEATVSRVAPHSLYLNVLGEAIQAKITNDREVAVGDTMNVLITHLGKNKIVVEVVAPE